MKETLTHKKLVTIDVNRIKANRNQPRRQFPEDELASLTSSILQNGLLQPLTVRRDGLEYELVAGERRLRASRMAGLRSVPCIIVEMGQEQACILALIENIERQNLNCFEEAEAILKMIEQYNLTQEEVARRLAKNQSTIANKLRLMRLTPCERERIVANQLSERHARALLKIQDEERRKEILDHVIKYKLKVDATERYIDNIILDQNKNRRVGIVVVKDVRLVLNTLNKAYNSIVTAGVPAVARQEDYEDRIEYIVSIPKMKKQSNV